MRDQVHNSNFYLAWNDIWIWQQRQKDIYDNTDSVQEPQRDVRTGSDSTQPTTSIALMFMQRKTELFWFYSEAFDLAFECLLASFQHSTSGSYIHLSSSGGAGQGREGGWLMYGAGKIIIWEAASPFSVKAVFQGPFTCPGVTQQPTTLCLMYM